MQFKQQGCATINLSKGLDSTFILHKYLWRFLWPCRYNTSYSLVKLWIPKMFCISPGKELCVCSCHVIYWTVSLFVLHIRKYIYTELCWCTVIGQTFRTQLVQGILYTFKYTIVQWTKPEQNQNKTV